MKVPFPPGRKSWMLSGSCYIYVMAGRMRFFIFRAEPVACCIDTPVPEVCHQNI